MRVCLLQGDNILHLLSMPDNSVSSIVTDAPYGLSFMNKKWDYDVPSVEFWSEVLRVLKPGGHVLSFGGTRTYHRMVVNMEDAGFEIRDQAMWLYGSGFPKSHNVGKKLDDWQGWGSALKPANEPICLARKPLEKGLTLAKNVLKYGTGAINIDECRVGVSENDPNWRPNETVKNPPNSIFGIGGGEFRKNNLSAEGRWPANIILDETAAEMLNEQSGPCKTGDINNKGPQSGFSNSKIYGASKGIIGKYKSDAPTGASRFFYVAKASKRERNAGLEDATNHHPTVKPIKLMEYLVKLITPPGGICLDPFMGSGTTGIACKNLGFDFIGIELDQEYFEIANKRIGAK